MENLLSRTDIKRFIEDTVRNSLLNRLPSDTGGVIYTKPLIGIADGYDPLFQEYKKIIGNFHLTPLELLKETINRNYDDSSLLNNTITNISVICWVLPFSKIIKKSNASHHGWPPSTLWSSASVYGEKLNNHLRQQLMTFIKNRGYFAVAPVLSPLWNKPSRYVSNWSERHALYAAGMGTFSLNRGFITQRGMAMRCGSIVVNTKLSFTKRKYQFYAENCLFYKGVNCRKCIERCPANAITNLGQNKTLCREYRDGQFELLKKKLGIKAEPDGCGLCQTGVPCESSIPIKNCT